MGYDVFYAHSFTNLLNPIYNAIEKRRQLVTHKLGAVFLDEVSTVDRNERTDGPAFIRDLGECRVIRLPRGVGIGHGQDFGRVD
jgi:hypothetical protein